MSGADLPTDPRPDELEHQYVDRMTRLLPYVDEDGMYQVRAPQWEAPRAFPDWRDHVPVEIVTIWDRMSIDARVVAYYMAKRLADVIGAGSR